MFFPYFIRIKIFQCPTRINWARTRVTTTMGLKRRSHKYLQNTILYYRIFRKKKKMKCNFNIFLQTLATIAQSFLLIGLGMELSMSTIVIQNLYQNSNAKFSLSLNEASWYGEYKRRSFILFLFFYYWFRFKTWFKYS